MNQLKTPGGSVAPALTLMIMSPLLTEVLPGATRLSALFVFPIEVCVWGGGALLIRYVVKRAQLGWLNMLVLALALAVAEEFLIQQTSLAPMVIRLKGVTYARSFGINYVYLLWALVYESVFAVLLPVYLTELVFPDRREQPWLNKAGLFAVIPFFLFGSYLAWFTWTHIARPKVYHVPVYHPPLAAIVAAAAVIGSLIYVALVFRKATARRPAHLQPLSLLLLGIAGALWAVVLYALMLLGFGIAPQFPPLVAAGLGLMMVLATLLVLPRWAADPRWQPRQQFALISGLVLGSMLAGYIGFIGSGGADLYFKVITNMLAVVLLVFLGQKISRRSTAAQH